MKTKYYSEILDKYFDTVKELEEAEKAEEEKKKLRSKEREERQQAVVEIQKAANDYLNIVAENNKVRQQLNSKEESAYNEYKTKMDDFSKTYNNYHLSYTYDGKNVEFKAEEARFVSLREYIRQRDLMLKKVMSDIF